MAEAQLDPGRFDEPETDKPAASGRSRQALLRRLTDVVVMPHSSIPVSDRNMAGDILLDMLLKLEVEDRQYCSDRLRNATMAPRPLLRYLAQCSFVVAEPLLTENEGLDSADLIQIAHDTTSAHRLAIAGRKVVDPAVANALADFAEPAMLLALLKNRGTMLQDICVDKLVKLSADTPALSEALIARGDLNSGQAMAMFWWCDGPSRRQILQRFAGDRMALIERCGDVFPMVAEEGFSDLLSMRTLQLIERRQRNRDALENSEFESLEEAVEAAAASGMTAELAQEIGFLAGVKPITIGKILSDKGGEGIAVLCKATGLKRHNLPLFWKALRRPATDTSDGHGPSLEYLSETYELLSVGRAQTTLRYWNWSLSSALSAAGKISDDNVAAAETLSSSVELTKLAFVK